MSYEKPMIKTIGIEELLGHLGPATAMIYGMDISNGGGKGKGYGKGHGKGGGKGGF